MGYLFKNKKKHLQKRRILSLMLAFILIVSILPVNGLTVKAQSGSFSIEKAQGWQESAYAEWAPFKGATQYNVYVKKTGESSYTKVDGELIRLYNSDNGDQYYRVDVPGLSSGEYNLKVVPVVDNTENTTNSAEKTVSVTSYDRTGFAWVNGTANGAYNEDGTLRSDAVVLYITEETKNTINLDVVTSNKGTTTSATGLQGILNLYKKGYESRPLDIRLIGKITDLAVMDGGDIVISGSSSSKRISCGITFEGIGEDATAYGWGLRIKNASNVEVRNIGFMDCDSSEGDDLGLQQDNDHIWVHNCDMFYGEAGGDSDQAKGDGALDCKKSTFVTFSYNHFYDNGKCNLLGLSEGTTEGLYITYHHNWYDHSDSRHPRCRYYSAHVYNNYYDGNAKYGVGACLGASVFVENNYYRNCKFPMMISMQGSDVISDWDTLTRDVTNLATFSKENGGMIKAYNNYMEGQQSFVSYQENNTEFDAYVVDSENEQVPSEVKSYAGGNTYNNFDTSDIMYSFTADSPQEAKANVEKYAGRVNGGDFKWEFNNEVDDISYAVNKELKSAVQNYNTKLAAVGGSSATEENQTSSEETTKSTETTQAQETTKSTESVTDAQTKKDDAANSYVHNFTTDGLNDSYYTISGNLTTSKGTVTYNGLTLTQALKMESSTKISFTAAADGKLTLVFGGSASAAGKYVYVNNEKVAVGSNEIATVSVSAGNVEIIKKDSINLFYMEFVLGNDVITETTKAAETTTKAQETTKETQTATKAQETTKETQTTTKETQATTKETEKTTEETKSTEEVSSDEYDKTSVNFSGAFTNLSKINDSQYAKKVYVSPEGTASGAGTKEDTLDLETAINNSTEGTAIILLGGTYSFDHQVTIATGNNGSANNYKVLKAADGEKVILDFSSQEYGDTATNDRGLQVEGNYWYINGITCYGAADNGMFVAGKNNIIERCILQANRDTGLQLSRKNSSLSNISDWPSNNYIVNCTSFDNCDPATGENADGFAAKLTCGEGNVFDGCISYCNCDDGWDLYAKEATGSIGVVTIRNCIAFNNGTLTNGNSEANGDMNGFKLGGSNGKVPTAHVVFNCLAFSNGKDGFTDNGNGGALSLTNCTSYNNVKTNFNFYRTTAGGTFTNLLSATGNGTDKFIGKINNSITYNSKKYYQVPYSLVGTSVNSGDKIGTVVDNPYTAGAFVSTTAPQITTDMDSTLRKADGTVTTDGYLMSTGSYASMGAKFNVANQIITVKANLVNSENENSNKEEATEETVKETTKATEETVKETTKATEESVKETEKATEESVKETTKATEESVKETTKATEEVVKETEKVTEESVKETTKATEESVKETTKATEEAVKETTKSEETDKENATKTENTLEIVPGEEVASNIITKLDDSDTDEVTVYSQDSSVKITSEVFNKMTVDNKKVTVGVTDENNVLQYSWSFDNTTLTDTNMDLDLAMSFETEKAEAIKLLTGKTDVMYLAFKHHGNLPGPAVIKVNVGNQYKDGDKVYLYYYNEESNRIETVGDSKELTVKDGYVEFTITHCSVYFLSQDTATTLNAVDMSKNNTVLNNSKLINEGAANINNNAGIATGDNSNILLYVILSILSILGISCVVGYEMKMKKNK